MRTLVFTMLFLSSIALAEPGTLLKDSELRAKPFGDAVVVATLSARDKVDITSRKGAWAQVKAENGMGGWLRVLNIRTGSGQRGDNGIASIASMFKTGSSGNTVTTGVKGLSEEQLENAQPNPEEAKRLDKYKNTDGDARSYAKHGRLTAQQLDYLSADGTNGDNEK